MRQPKDMKKEYNSRKKTARKIQNSPSDAFLKTQKKLEKEREASQKRALQRLISRHHSYKWSYQSTLTERAS